MSTLRSGASTTSVQLGGRVDTLGEPVLAVSHRTRGLASVAEDGRAEDDLAGLHGSSSSSSHFRDRGRRSGGCGGGGACGRSGSRAGAGDHGGSGVFSVDSEDVLTSEKRRPDSKLER